MFRPGQRELGAGFEAFAEDGDTSMLERYYSFALAQEDQQQIIVPSHWSGAQTEVSLAPGETRESIVYPYHDLQLHIRLSASNDRFLSFGAQGLLMITNGHFAGGDVTNQLKLWDAGTEIDEPLGAGANQPDRQADFNTGSEENGIVHQVSDPALPPINQLIRVSLTPMTREEYKRYETDWQNQVRPTISQAQQTANLIGCWKESFTSNYEKYQALADGSLSMTRKVAGQPLQQAAKVSLEAGQISYQLNGKSFSAETIGEISQTYMSLNIKQAWPDGRRGNVFYNKVESYNCNF